MSGAHKFFIMGSALILSMLLVSCDSNKNASDDYYFEQKEYTLINQKYSFVVISSSKEWDKQVKENVGQFYSGNDIGAFSKLRLNKDDFNLKGSECIIYIKDPAWKYEPEYIGHEITHCLYGKWHPSQRGKG